MVLDRRTRETSQKLRSVFIVGILYAKNRLKQHRAILDLTLLFYELAKTHVKRPLDPTFRSNVKRLI
jgi:hypothetical protein